MSRSGSPSADVIARVRNMRNEGHSFTKIAKAFGMTKGQIAGIVRRYVSQSHALRQSDVERRHQELLPRVIELISQKWSAKCIANELHLARSTVQAWAKQNGLRFNSAGGMRFYAKPGPKPRPPQLAPAAARRVKSAQRVVAVPPPSAATPPVTAIIDASPKPRTAIAPVATLVPPRKPASVSIGRPVDRCQWPLSSGRPWRFCDAPVEGAGRPYCAACAVLAYVPAATMVSRSARFLFPNAVGASYSRRPA